MQKPSKPCFRVYKNLLNSCVAFVAFVAKGSKCANAGNVGVIFTETLATIRFLNKKVLLPLLPLPSKIRDTGNKQPDGGNNGTIHCCHHFSQNSAIQSNGAIKQQRQQRQHGFQILWGVCCFPENTTLQNCSKTVKIYE